ncbi:TolC family protein [Sphingobacterium thalpophilum]|uniref:Type I secretion outer membrane protein, TolC family n=1 Tax=Sphingobacterium thalpophilum TaxID=259 RepID=A0A4U9V5M0_9SPHI|nr:TolC family protein [Sphingobacterium thalpophilum]VTR41123.1 type I secretion outer membrane protein, TolC family [Sphingobacterium thalpophilum]
MIRQKRKTRLILLWFCSLGAMHALKAQTSDSTIVKLSINEAIRQSKESNKLIEVFRNETSATQAELQDAKLGVLPRILTNASYQRYSDVTLFEDVLGESHSIPKPPNANAGALGVEAAFNLYSGGRQKAAVAGAKHKDELATINLNEQEANIGLQVAVQYLDMVKYYYHEKLIKDQERRAQTRLKNINAFYKNGKVTKSDVLRADVALSNIQLNLTANRNDCQISSHKLLTFLNKDYRTKIILEDTASLHLPAIGEVEQLLGDYSETFSILKVKKNIELQENRTKLTKSYNLPSINLFGGYGFNYPNTLVFPPQPQTFAVGLVGIKATYDISSLYQNKNKVKASYIRENELKQQKEWIEDNVQQEAKALITKYAEALNRMSVIKKSIEQAEANYNIQNAKYSNQLSLLTDLLEADNLYYEAKFNYIQANIGALSLYYRLLFLTGKL